MEAVARQKREGYKIEVFYFLAQGWIDRAWASTKKEGRLAAWWGNGNYENFRERTSVDRARALCRRFRNELGYAYAEPFAIYKKGEGLRTMYYMIHASDHPEACLLMSRAVPEGSTDGERGRHTPAFPRTARTLINLVGEPKPPQVREAGAHVDRHDGVAVPVAAPAHHSNCRRRSATSRSQSATRRRQGSMSAASMPVPRWVNSS